MINLGPIQITKRKTLLSFLLPSYPSLPTQSYLPVSYTLPPLRAGDDPERRPRQPKMAGFHTRAWGYFCPVELVRLRSSRGFHGELQRTFQPPPLSTEIFPTMETIALKGPMEACQLMPLNQCSWPRTCLLLLRRAMMEVQIYNRPLKHSGTSHRAVKRHSDLTWKGKEYSAGGAFPYQAQLPSLKSSTCSQTCTQTHIQLGTEQRSIQM